MQKMKKTIEKIKKTELVCEELAKHGTEQEESYPL